MATVNTRTANSRETRTPVMSTHVTILLSTKRVQGQLTVMKSTTRLARRDTRRESNFSHPRRAPQDSTRSASSLQQEPPTPRHIVDWSGLEELDSQTSNIRGTTPSDIPGSSLDLLGIKTFASSASTSQSVSSTTHHMSPLESSSISERQLSLHDEAEEDSDNKFVNPVSGASHPEAFATFGKRMIEAKRRSHWIQRFIGPPGGSTPRTVASDLDPTNPPWMALVPRSMKKGRSFDNLRLTRSEVGAGVGSKGKGKGKDRDMLSQVPDDSLYMLLPLWPHETDAASAVDEQGQQTPRVQEQNMYLLVYYVPFDERGEDNPAKKPSRSRLQKREQERQIDIRHGFKVIGQLVTHSDLNGSGIRLPVRGLSVTGPLAEAELAIPPASLRDMYPDSFVIGACMDGSGTTIEFFPEGLEKLGLCVPRTEPVRLDIDPAEPVLEQPLTAIGRAAVEVAWLGCMALMTFDGPQSQGPA